MHTYTEPLGTAKVIIRQPLGALGVSATLRINEDCQRLAAEGRRIYRFGFGQSPFPVPEYMQRALGHRTQVGGYLPVQGLPELRAAIAQHHSSGGADVSPGQVIIGPGSKELIFHLLMLLDGPLLLPAPSWVSYAAQAKILDKQVVWIQTRPEEDYKITATDLEGSCVQLTSQQKILLLNYPNNPTGVTYSKAELHDLAAVARAHNVWLISDEIYGQIHHHKGHISMAEVCPEQTILTSGISKWLGAGGWRLGYAVLPTDAGELMQRFCALASETFTSVSGPIQYAAVGMFSDPTLSAEYLDYSRTALTRVGQWCWRKLVTSGVPTPEPQGGFYLFPSFDSYRDSWPELAGAGSEDFCRWVLAKSGVALLPGSAFGRLPGEWTARLAYVDFDGEQMVGRGVSDIDAGEPDEWMQRWAPSVYEGMTSLLQTLQNG